jgi:CheY-like chemotaxis protein
VIIVPQDTTPVADLGDLVILVVEDEAPIADELMRALRQLGARLLGPVGHLHEALLLLESADRLDGAVLDTGLHGDAVYPLADALTARGVPYVFVTGYAASAAIPARHRDVPRYEKSIDPGLVAQALALHVRERDGLSGGGSIEGIS